MVTTERTENDRAWWSRLYNLDQESRMQFIVDTYTQGEITDWQLWDVLSNWRSPLSWSNAGLVYTKLGYVSFSGYPLVKITSRR
jgi:hypothetical protein